MCFVHIINQCITYKSNSTPVSSHEELEHSSQTNTVPDIQLAWRPHWGRLHSPHLDSFNQHFKHTLSWHNVSSHSSSSMHIPHSTHRSTHKMHPRHSGFCRHLSLVQSYTSLTLLHLGHTSTSIALPSEE